MKVPEPRKLPSGTWFIQLRLGGQSVSVSAPSKKECIRRAGLIKAEHRAGTRVVKKGADKTLHELMQAYIDALPDSTSPSTVRGYMTIKRTRFLSVADVPFRSVLDWQKVIDEEATHVCAKTIKNAWAFACSAMRREDVHCPTVKLPQTIQKEKQWLEPEQVLQLVQLLKGTECEIPLLLALHGLRRSEILAMTFDKIDLPAQTITVHGAAVLDSNGELVQKRENKNRSSRRVIPIMIPELSKAIEALPPEQRTGRVFSGNVNMLYRVVNRICQQNGLPEVGVHGLRHSFASLAYHLKLSEQETMELGGWADYNTMRKIYTHLAKIDRLKGQNKIAAFFAKNAAQKEANANEKANDQ